MIKSKMTVLYVDFIEEDESCAVTENKASVSFNLAKINEHYKRDLNYPHKQFFNAGKYIVTIIPVNSNTAKLLFYDFKKSERTLKQLLEEADHPQIHKEFAQAVNYAKENYEKEYYDVVLTVGSPRISK